MSTQPSSVPTRDAQASRAGPSPLDGHRPDAGAPRSLPRHLAPSQRRPGLVRSILSAALLVTVVLAVGTAVVLGSIDRLKHPLSSNRGAVGAQGSSRLGSQGAAITTTSQPLLREGNFEVSRGAIRGEHGTRLDLVAVGADGSAHAARLTCAGAPVSQVGLLDDHVTRPPRPGARYSATVQVKASRPGQVVQIQLIESVNGRRVSADPQMLRLADTQWRELSVQHEVSNQGSVIGVEVTFIRLPRGQYGWVDELRVEQTL